MSIDDMCKIEPVTLLTVAKEKWGRPASLQEANLLFKLYEQLLSEEESFQNMTHETRFSYTASVFAHTYHSSDENS